MKNYLALLGGVLFALALCASKPALAQDQKGKAISAEDQKAIVELFKDVDPKLYRLEFNKGKDVHGSRKVAMKELEQVRKVRNPAGENGYVALVVRDDGVMYILAATKSNLATVLGREKTAKLNTIMAKYSRQSTK